MQDRFIIYLHAEDLTHPSWAVIEAGQIRQSTMHDDASLFAEIADKKEIIVVVPAEDVLHTTTKLPKMNRRKLREALPFAIEEELIDEVEDLHFAAGEQTPEGDLSVVVVSHEKMEQWLLMLQTWGINADIMIPATMALPFEDHTWTVALTDTAIIRTGAYQGFVSERHNLKELLDIAIKTAFNAPSLIHIYNYTDDQFDHTIDDVSLKEHLQKPERFIHDLAQQAIKTPYINLLQGPYAVKKSKFPEMTKLLRVSAYLTAGLLILLFLYPAISYFILKMHLNDLNQQIAFIYKRHFPQSTNMIAPKLRMEDKLQKLNNQIGEHRYLGLIAAVGKAMSGNINIKLKRMDFQNNQLTLELTAATSEDFSAFTDGLIQQGLEVKQQNVALSGSRINATVLID